MKILYSFLILFLCLFTGPTQASMLNDVDELVKDFGALKILEAPRHQSIMSKGDYQQKIAVMDENSLRAFLERNDAFRAILTLPQIQKVEFEGGYPAMVDNVVDLREKKQGVPSFLNVNAQHTAPYYKTTTSIVNCVGVVLDQYTTLPHQNGLMHVDDDQFEAGSFESWLDQVDVRHRSATRVSLTSCYFSPLLESIYRMLNTKGFGLYEADIVRAYHSQTVRIMPLEMIGMTPEKLKTITSSEELALLSANPELMPTYIIYDFATHQHLHLGFAKPAENNSFLVEYLRYFDIDRQRELNINVECMVRMLSGGSLTEAEMRRAQKFMSSKTKEEIVLIIRNHKKK